MEGEHKSSTRLHLAGSEVASTLSHPPAPCCCKHRVMSLEEDAGLLPGQQQAISSPACAKIAHENPFPSDGGSAGLSSC